MKIDISGYIFCKTHKLSTNDASQRCPAFIVWKEENNNNNSWTTVQSMFPASTHLRGIRRKYEKQRWTFSWTNPPSPKPSWWVFRPAKPHKVSTRLFCNVVMGLGRCEFPIDPRKSITSPKISYSNTCAREINIQYINNFTFYWPYATPYKPEAVMQYANPSDGRIASIRLLSNRVSIVISRYDYLFCRRNICDWVIRGNFRASFYELQQQQQFSKRRLLKAYQSAVL